MKLSNRLGTAIGLVALGLVCMTGCVRPPKTKSIPLVSRNLVGIFEAQRTFLIFSTKGERYASSIAELGFHDQNGGCVMLSSLWNAQYGGVNHIPDEAGYLYATLLVDNQGSNTGFAAIALPEDTDKSIIIRSVMKKNPSVFEVDVIPYYEITNLEHKKLVLEHLRGRKAFTVAEIDSINRQAVELKLEHFKATSVNRKKWRKFYGIYKSKNGNQLILTKSECRYSVLMDGKLITQTLIRSYRGDLKGSEVLLLKGLDEQTGAQQEAGFELTRLNRHSIDVLRIGGLGGPLGIYEKQ